MTIRVPVYRALWCRARANLPHPFARMARFNPAFAAALLGKNAPAWFGSGFAAGVFVIFGNCNFSSTIRLCCAVNSVAALTVKSSRRRRCFASFLLIWAWVANHLFDGFRRPALPRVPGTRGLGGQVRSATITREGVHGDW